MSDYPMLISNKLHSFRNFGLRIYQKGGKGYSEIKNAERLQRGGEVPYVTRKGIFQNVSVLLPIVGGGLLLTGDSGRGRLTLWQAAARRRWGCGLLRPQGLARCGVSAAAGQWCNRVRSRCPRRRATARGGGGVRVSYS